MYRDRACDKRMIGLEARSAELYLARRGGELFAAQSYVPFTITALRATQAEAARLTIPTPPSASPHVSHSPHLASSSHSPREHPWGRKIASAETT